MVKKEVASAMQTIEFVLFTIKNGDIEKLHSGEVEEAHKKAREIMHDYLAPIGAFEN
jgi:hypothetical protein